MARFLERYPKADEIYITSAMDGDHGPTSHHYGLSYRGSPTAAIDIGAGGYPAGSEKMREVARWLYDNFSDYTVELIHDDDGFYVKNQVRDPGGDIYGAEVRNAHLDHVHWATSADLMSAMEQRADRPLRDLVPAERSLGVPTKGIDMAFSTAEQQELLRLLREFAPLARRLEGQLDGDRFGGFDGAPTALGAMPVGDDYWNHGYPDGHAAASGRIEPQIDAQQLLNLRGGRVSGPPLPSARELPRTRAIDSGREAARAIEAIDPGPPVDFPRKIGDVTGPGHTDRFGMAATDLGVLARTPSGRILAVFGDTFRDAWVGSPDWRAPVALFSDTKTLDAGIVWSEAAGPNPHYAQQLWPYNHFPPGGPSTVLPSDIMTIGDTMYLHVSAHFPFGNVGFTEIWKSVNDGRTWTLCPHRFDAHIHGGLAQLWTWDVGDDGFVYIMSTGFRVNRDQPIILRRVPVDRLEDPGAYEGWGFGPNGWAWGNEPTPVLDGGYGELCLRRIDGQWVLVAFNAGDYRLDVRVFFDITSNLYDATTFSPIHGTAWGQETDDAVAQLYGPSILPGSRVGGGFHIFLSQWQNPGVWPYHVMQFKIPMLGARGLRELPPEGRRRKAAPKKVQPRKSPSAKKTPAKKARARK
jgi:hypothetical protein